MHFSKVEICGVNTAKLQNLSDEEKRELLKRTKDGDETAREKLIAGNLRLVLSIIQRFSNRKENMDDLFQVGCTGLIKAIDSFDSRNGTRFATYASKCLQNEILMYFRSQKKTACEVSISEPIDIDKDGNPLTYIDVISTEDTIADDIDSKIKTAKARKALLAVLDEREREIVILRYGLDGNPAITQREVAEKLGISRSYVSRIEKSALKKMGGYLSSGIF